MKKKPSSARAPEPLPPGFDPLPEAWEGGSNPPLFRSEWSARYFIRVNRERLIQAKALARISGETYFHQERFREVLLEAALRNVREIGQGASA